MQINNNIVVLVMSLKNISMKKMNDTSLEKSLKL